MWRPRRSSRSCIRHTLAARARPRHATAPVGSARAEPDVPVPVCSASDRWRATLAALRAPAAGVPLRAARPGPLLHRDRRGLRRPAVQLRRPRRVRSCSTSAGAPATSATPSGRPGATYYALDADVGELAGLGEIAPGTVIGSGMDLPFADGSVDICYSSNVLEHVSDPWRMADEMLRVTRPRRDCVFISYTVWFGPVGRARDGALALPGRGARPPALRPRARPRAQEQVRRVAVPGHRRAPAWRWARAPDGDQVVDVAPALQPALVALAPPRPAACERW